MQILQTISGKKESLENVVVKPNLEGRKTIGNLEIHTNGMRYVSTKGFKVDIPFSNIKHAFFQPCQQDELISIIHFRFKVPMTINNKKFQDIQFFKESGIAADDIDMKGGRRRMNDLDELELEDRERQAKKKLSQKFFNFAKLIQNQSEKTSSVVVFDIPIDEFAFQGCPQKSVVKIRPTMNCLIAISEFPFFCVDLKDIEAVHFERVSFGIKNFDMAIIYKDFQTFKHINSIPREQLDQIKAYLNEIGILYSEGVVPMNWNAVLTQIRDDFEAFLESGGWRFLQEDEAEEGEDEDSELAEDPEFKDVSEDNSEDESDDGSDFSDEADEDGDDYSEEVDGEVSEGLSWDELEKKAYEDDKQAAQRRQQVNDDKGANKRKPERRR